MEITFFESTEQFLTGPAIEHLKKTAEDMYHRGNPAEQRNDFGFNRNGWESYTRIRSQDGYSQPGLDLGTAEKLLNILRVYKNSQVPDFNSIEQSVRDEIKKTVEVHDHVIVYNNEAPTYNAIKCHIPGVDRSMKIKINKVVRSYLASINARQERDRYGNLGYADEWEYFTKLKSYNDYNIHLAVAKDIIDILKGSFKVEYKDPSETLPSIESAKTPEKAGPEDNTIKVIGRRDTAYGPKFVIAYNLPKAINDGLRYEMDKKGLLATKSTAKQKNTGIFGYLQLENNVAQYGFTKAAEREYKQVLDILATKLTVPNDLLSKLMEFAENAASEVEIGGDNKISFTDMPDWPETDARYQPNHSPCKINIKFKDLKTGVMMNEFEKNTLKQIVQYTMPGYQWDKDNFAYIVNGDYQQYVKLGRMLAFYKYNEVAQLREIVKQKLNEKRIKKEQIDGDIPEGFMEKIPGLLDKMSPDLELYEAQKEGIAHAVHKKAFILGDETGLGKTVQIIGAAECKMKTKNYAKNCLIITLQPLVNQWTREILRVIGDESQDLISTDPMHPKRWTVIYYNQFSGGGVSKAKEQPTPQELLNQEKSIRRKEKIDKVKESIQNGNFGIVIFDELHEIKHELAQKSRNIEEAVEKIPYKWGATATLSANKPFDVYNQLRILGHFLGGMHAKKFKKELAGITTDGRYDKEKTEEERIKAAELLNKWLNISGVYIRRSKNELREMPDLKVGQEHVHIDNMAYRKRYSADVAKLKIPTGHEGPLEISLLLTARRNLAIHKAPMTVDIARSLIVKGERIVIFTAFKESAEILKSGLTRMLESINPKYKLLTFLASDTKRLRAGVKDTFNNDQDYRILLMSLRMGGVGIDFPNAARKMIINDYDWTPQSGEQSEGRIYRINTTHPVEIIYTIAKDTEDEAIYDKVQKKREIAAIIQRYRKDLVQAKTEQQNTKNLDAIVASVKQIKQIDQEINDLVRNSYNESVQHNINSYLKYRQTLTLLK